MGFKVILTRWDTNFSQVHGVGVRKLEYWSMLLGTEKQKEIAIRKGLHSLTAIGL